MREPLLLMTITMLGVGPAAHAYAQGPNYSDEFICKKLTERPVTGLFIGYQDGETPTRVNGVPPQYSLNVRFYFLPGGTPREEGVWHIRTQTATEAVRGTDQVFVYRPRVETRCSRRARDTGGAISGNRGVWPEFDSNDRLIGLNRYAEHHAPEDKRWDLKQEKYFGLGVHFHMSIQDGIARDGCVKTDDPAVFTDLWSVYGFEGVSRSKSRTARTLTLFGPASAQDLSAPRHDGLSSELRYHDSSDPACFGFSAPLWGGGSPAVTTIRIKQLRGRNVSTIFNRTVTWAQK
jgi:hypothetical protein